ncbi:MAG: hypothetical protein Q9214_007558, partial [Letrouitia sp. 1 TL-2023]
HFDINKSLVKEYELNRSKNFCGFYDTVQAFTPLLRRGTEKKILTVSLVPAHVVPKSIVEDPQIRAQCYVNKTVATMNNRLKSEGILIFVMGPELVKPESTGTNNLCKHAYNSLSTPSSNTGTLLGVVVSKFSACASEGGTAKESVSCMLKVLDMVKVENDGGSFISFSGSQLHL